MSLADNPSIYDNQYAHDNVYGHAVALLKRHLLRTDEPIYLDIGCGFGRIAEILRSELRLTYVGCDLAEPGRASLAERGFEAHPLELGEENATYGALKAIIGGRPVAAIGIIDTFEHLADPGSAMRALRRVAAETNAFVLVSVPNNTHRDIGYRLLFGQWDYTPAGLLDHTHRLLFSDNVLRKMLARNGLHIVDAYDVEYPATEQAFPVSHPALQPATHLRTLLDAIRESADPHGKVTQLVRLCSPGPSTELEWYVEADETERPFLSVVMRTQGKRSDTLSEVLTCLAGQSVTDFELLIVGHDLDIGRQIGVEQLIEDLPKWLAEKTNFVRVSGGTRTRPLNVGFDLARGRYIVILDDDDLVFGHWVESFRELEARNAGKILRSVAATQSADRTSGPRAEGSFELPYAREFDWIQHMETNQSPGMTLAFPRGLFHDLQLRFDENLTTTEDWDYLLRSASIVGVASTPNVTAVYRRWLSAENSSSDHPAEEWALNRAVIQHRLDMSPLVIWPAGTTKIVRSMRMELRIKDEEIDILKNTIIIRDESTRIGLIARLVDLYTSSSWRLTAPIRLMGRLFGRKPFAVADVWGMSNEELEVTLGAVMRSSSWRLFGPIRRVARRLRPSVN